MEYEPNRLERKEECSTEWNEAREMAFEFETSIVGLCQQWATDKTIETGNTLMDQVSVMAALRAACWLACGHQYDFETFMEVVVKFWLSVEREHEDLNSVFITKD